MNKEGNYVLLDLERKQCAILPKIFTMKSSDSENKYSFFSEGKLIEGILNCSGTFEDCKAKVKDLGQDYKILYSMRSTIKNLVKKDTNNNQVASVTSTTSDSICKVDEIRNEVESEVVQEEITDQSNKHFKEIPITALLKTINKLFVDRYNLQNTKFSTSSPVSKEATNNSVKESYPKLHIPRSISAGGKRLDEEKKRDESISKRMCKIETEIQRLDETKAAKSDLDEFACQIISYFEDQKKTEKDEIFTQKVKIDDVANLAEDPKFCKDVLANIILNASQKDLKKTCQK